MDKERLEYLQRIEEHAAETGWVSPLTQEDKDYLVCFRAVCKRYNIDFSKATRLERDFVIRTTEAKFQKEKTEKK